jgi:hypothetical protein
MTTEAAGLGLAGVEGREELDLCVSCSSAIKTFANLQVVRDEKHLLPTYMPPGGCTCQSMKTDPACPRCYPSTALCQPCGAAATKQTAAALAAAAETLGAK